MRRNAVGGMNPSQFIPRIMEGLRNPIVEAVKAAIQSAGQPAPQIVAKPLYSRVFSSLIGGIGSLSTGCFNLFSGIAKAYPLTSTYLGAAVVNDRRHYYFDSAHYQGFVNHTVEDTGTVLEWGLTTITPIATKTFRQSAEKIKNTAGPHLQNFYVYVKNELKEIVREGASGVVNAGVEITTNAAHGVLNSTIGLVSNSMRGDRIRPQGVIANTFDSVANIFSNSSFPFVTPSSSSFTQQNISNVSSHAFNSTDIPEGVSLERISGMQSAAIGTGLIGLGALGYAAYRYYQRTYPQIKNLDKLFSFESGEGDERKI